MIKDSGERRQFYDSEGNPMGVRDIQEGKGRCDLMPLEEVAICMKDYCLDRIAQFKNTGETRFLGHALNEFAHLDYAESLADMFLEVSKHFEEGHKKYPPAEDGTPNWQLGIPCNCYIDSAVRHYLKHRRGDADEPHDRAFVWNLLCCMWTAVNKPELNSYAKTD